MPIGRLSRDGCDVQNGRVVEKYLEREVKLDVDESFRLPNIDDLVPAGGILTSVVVPIDSTYFDTERHDLLAANVTLRRRAGEAADTGWQLKLPAVDGRTELRVPLGPGTGVPTELRELTAGLRRGRGLRQVARIRTERTAHRLFDVSGTLLAEVADDRVRATTPGDKAVLNTWREVEVETGAGDARLVRRIVKRLRKAGARDAAGPSKLARTLTDPAAAPTADAAPPAGAGSSQGSATVGDLAIAYLHEQRAALLSGDLELRGGSDFIHHTRVGTRRFRSTLRTFHTLFDADRTAAMDAELRWYAALLGAVRDPDVLRLHLRSVIAELPARVVFGPVATQIEQHLVEERERQRATLRRALNGRRYVTLLDEIDRWLADPPFTAAAGAPKARAGELAARAQRKFTKRLQVAADDERPEGLHRARKAAKRTRYAFELAAPALAAKVAKTRIKKITAMQDILGEIQDSVVAGEALLHMGIRAGTTPGGNGFTYGVLFALEQRRAEIARHRVIGAAR